MTPEQMRRSGYLRIFVSYYRPHLAIFLLDMVCALGICLVDLLFPMVSRHALNELLPRSLYGAFFALMTVLLLAYVLKGVFTFMAVAFAIAIIALWIWGQETARRSVEDTSAAPQK